MLDIDYSVMIDPQTALHWNMDRLCGSIAGGIGACFSDKKKPLVREALRLVVWMPYKGPPMEHGVKSLIYALNTNI